MDMQYLNRFNLSQTHAGAATIAFMYGLATGSSLTRQMGIRIALCLAQRGLCVFSVESLHQSGQGVGMNRAEMAANLAGTSHDAKGTACLKFVRVLIDSLLPPSAADLRGMHEVGYAQAEILEVVAQVGMHTLLARMAMVIAAPCEMVNCGGMDSLKLPAV